MNQSLITSCRDILYKNMSYQHEKVYCLYDRESPLACLLSDAWHNVLKEIPRSQMREFKNPPQPLYRGGLINPDNPHISEQKRVITSHNIHENIQIGLKHHEEIKSQIENEDLGDSQIENIKNELINLEKDSVVILIQSTNFRLSTFRIRLELFHRGIHVVEFNHLAYIPVSQIDTFVSSLQYRTDEYMRLENAFSDRITRASKIRIQSVNNDFLTFGPVENIRGNTGNYTGVENKGGTFPIGEIFTEAKDLSQVNGMCLIDTFPREDFSIAICEPFTLHIENGRVLPSEHFPSEFQKLYDWIVAFEGEVMVRELGFGLNPAISTATPLSDINFHERKVGIHLSLGKKHGIYGKKLPKSEVQRFHIDVFVALKEVLIDQESVYNDGRWTI